MSLAMAWGRLTDQGRAHFDDYLNSRRAGLLPPERLAPEHRPSAGNRVVEISSWAELRRITRRRAAKAEPIVDQPASQGSPDA